MVGTSESRLAGDENLPKRIRSKGLGFSEKDLLGIQYPHDDALVVSININNYDVHRVLVDSRSSVNTLYFDAFARMGLRMEDLRPVDSTLIGFTGDAITPEGMVTLIVWAGEWPCMTIVYMDFLVTKLRSPYNAILERLGQMTLGAVISVPHLMMKFPIDWGIGAIRGSQAAARHCFIADLQSRKPEVDGLDAREELTEQRGEPVEKLVEIPLEDAWPDRVIRIGSQLDGKAWQDLIDFLQRNADVFTWTASDMPGISPDVLVHHLNVDEAFRPIK